MPSSELLPYSAAPPEFKAFWSRLVRRVERIGEDPLLQPSRSLPYFEDIGHDWRGVDAAWNKLVSMPGMPELIVFTARRPFGEGAGHRADTLLTMAVSTENVDLVEKILSLHDKVDVSQSWVTRVNSADTLLISSAASVGVITALARRAPQQIPSTLDELASRFRYYRDRLPSHDPSVVRSIQQINGWAQAAQRDPIIAQGVSHWAQSHVLEDRGHASFNEALEALRALGIKSALEQVASPLSSPAIGTKDSSLRPKI